jgi:hypothetical protein
MSSRCHNPESHNLNIFVAAVNELGQFGMKNVNQSVWQISVLPLEVGLDCRRTVDLSCLLDIALGFCHPASGSLHSRPDFLLFHSHNFRCHFLCALCLLCFFITVLVLWV